MSLQTIILILSDTLTGLGPTNKYVWLTELNFPESSHSATIVES